MATKDPAAMQQRIINHMNADHHDSLVRYLEFHHHVPSSIARHARLTSLTLLFMHISTSPHSIYLIPLDPPLTSFSETRARVVEMDAAALAGLGRADVTVKRYTTPSALGLLNMTLVALTFLLMHRRANLAADDGHWLLFRPLVARFPATFAFLYRLQPWLFLPVLAIHTAEAWWLDRSRLRRHSVPRMSAVWWKWVVGHFFEGFTSYQRFDRLVLDERAKKEKRTH